MKKIYDTIIIGGGPAGYTTALYASRAGLSALVVEKMTVGGQLALTDMVENYPGFDEGIDGFTLGMKMQASAERFGAETMYAEVLSIETENKPYRFLTTEGELYAHTVVIATGAYPRLVGVPGEEKFLGRGVHICAHCDGRFYKGRTVLVVGGGNSALEDALYLARLCERVILVHRRDTFRAERVLVDALQRQENIEVRYDSVLQEVLGEEKMTGVRLRNVRDGEVSELAPDGVFISVGREPASAFLPKEIERDASGYIIADETTRTSVDGVYAIGDVRTKPLRQIVTAVADGAVAVEYMKEYLTKNNF